MSHTRERQASALRGISNRLSTTPTRQLPGLVPHLVHSLRACEALLATQASGLPKDSLDVVVLHRIKTQITALLNDKTPEAHWSAAVLIKTVVDLGGWQILQDCGHWVRGLLSVLGKPGSFAAKRLCAIALTRIFLLMHDYPSLTREITTPSLPAFITACLNLISPLPSSKSSSIKTSTSLVNTVLDCLCKILPEHPTIFRTFLLRLKSLLLPLISPAIPSTSNSTSLSYISGETSRKARTLFVLMHFCAPKANSTVDWDKAMTASLQEAHSTANKIFRAIIEDWEALGDFDAQQEPPASFSSEVEQSERGPLDLSAWNGLYAGSARIKDILRLVEHFIRTQTAASVAFPLGNVIDLLGRLFNVTVPSVQHQDQIRLNPQIGKVERDALWAELPGIHAAAVDVLVALVQLCPASCSMDAVFVEQLEWIFRHEQQDDELCESIYIAMSMISQRSGIAFSRQQARGLFGIVESCCVKLGPVSEQAEFQVPSATFSKDKQGSKQAVLNGDNFLHTPQDKITSQTMASSTVMAATDFLAAFLANSPAQLIPQRLRSLVDRTMIWRGERQVMLVSVLNPPQAKQGQKPQSSILPFLAQAYPNCVGTEAILRPRMPVLTATQYQMRANDDEPMSDDEAESGTEPAFVEYREPEGTEPEVVASAAAINVSQPHSIEVTNAFRDQATSPLLPISSQTTETLDPVDSADAIVSADAVVSADETIVDSLGSRKREAPTEEPLVSTPAKRARSEEDASNVLQASAQEPQIASEITPQPGAIHETVDAGAKSAPMTVPAQVILDVSDDDDENFVIPELTVPYDSDYGE